MICIYRILLNDISITYYIGSLRRIENWDKLSKAEQANSFRLIAARNKKRIEILKQKEIEAKNENEKTENPNNESERINKSEEMINNS